MQQRLLMMMLYVTPAVTVQLLPPPRPCMQANPPLLTFSRSTAGACSAAEVRCSMMGRRLPDALVHRLQRVHDQLGTACPVQWGDPWSGATQRHRM